MPMGSRRQSRAAFLRMVRHKPDSVFTGVYRNYYPDDGEATILEGEERPFRDISGVKVLRGGRLDLEEGWERVVSQFELFFTLSEYLVHGADKTPVVVGVNSDRIFPGDGTEWLIQRAILSSDGALWEFHMVKV